VRANSTTAALALVRDTFREAFARKIFWAFFACSTALILFFIFIMRVDVVQGALATASIFGRSAQSSSVEKLVAGVHAGVANIIYSIGMCLAVFASAGLISAVFEPGRIELLLSKPVSRYQILLGRYVGNVLVVAANLFYLILSIWIIFGIKTGIWHTGFLFAGVSCLFVFCVLLTVSLLVGVLWESAAVSIIATFGVMVISLIVSAKSTWERLLSSEWSRDIVRALYYALPRIFDIGRINHNLIVNEPITDWAALWTTAAFGAVMLGASLFFFARRDF
jgi:ABC-type transport system involved in multi-copper enzyme maturation permease subunit